VGSFHLGRRYLERDSFDVENSAARREAE
jgi:hypothetical protein